MDDNNKNLKKFLYLSNQGINWDLFSIFLNKDKIQV